MKTCYIEIQSRSFKNKREGWGWLKRGEEGLKNFLPLEGGGRRF